METPIKRPTVSLRFNERQLELLNLVIANGWGDGDFATRLTRAEVITFTNLIKKFGIARAKLR
jgi:hypothetical protein